MVQRLKEFEKGVILINKPPDVTSFRVVARVRRYLLSQGGSTNEGSRVQGFKSLKVGHTGTLDSMATGLLIILVGEATKRQGDFTRLPKEYEGEFVLGLESDTYSADGRLRFPSLVHGKAHCSPQLLANPPQVDNVPLLSSVKRVQIEKVFKKFLGEQEQAVPPFSAIQVKGERLHRLARKGRPIPELPRRRINVERLELLDYRPIASVGAHCPPEADSPIIVANNVPLPSPEEFLGIAPKVKFRASVSSGTYIRSLVVDIGKELGTGAVLTQLTRTKIGPYRLSDAIDLPLRYPERSDGESKTP
jgi:tRNA pseudouridine55 synthase